MDDYGVDWQKLEPPDGQWSNPSNCLVSTRAPAAVSGYDQGPRHGKESKVQGKSAKKKSCTAWLTHEFSPTTQMMDAQDS